MAHVVPCTEVSASLCAEFRDGDTACGETQIAARRKPIRRVWLAPLRGASPQPSEIEPAPGVVDAILAADAIVLGPGSLYTSVIPCLLPTGIADAIRDSAALKILVCNLMTQPGETDFYSAADHLRAVQNYLGPSGIHVCLLNSQPVPPSVAAPYAAAGAKPVMTSAAEVEQLGVAPVALDLLDLGEPEARHDPMKLARWVVALTRASQRARDLRFGEVRCFAADAVPVLS